MDFDLLTSSRNRSILVVTGLTREARVAAGEGVVTVVSGGSREQLDKRLATLDPARLKAVISFGLAGGLDHAFRQGNLVLATGVASDGAALACCSKILAAWTSRLDGEVTLHRDEIAGVDLPLLNPSDKAALRAQTGSGAVDMESHVAAAFAARHDLPFGVIRAICDPAERRLPAIAGTAMRDDGRIDLPAVARGLMRDPAQIGGLIRAGRDAGAAFRTLGRVRRLLGGGFGLNL